jgi:hypothetical protein
MNFLSNCNCGKKDNPLFSLMNLSIVSLVIGYRYDLQLSFIPLINIKLNDMKSHNVYNSLQTNDNLHY